MESHLRYEVRWLTASALQRQVLPARAFSCRAVFAARGLFWDYFLVYVRKDRYKLRGTAPSLTLNCRLAEARLGARHGACQQIIEASETGGLSRNLPEIGNR